MLVVDTSVTESAFTEGTLISNTLQVSKSKIWWYQRYLQDKAD